MRERRGAAVGGGRVCCGGVGILGVGGQAAGGWGGGKGARGEACGRRLKEIREARACSYEFTKQKSFSSVRYQTLGKKKIYFLFIFLFLWRDTWRDVYRVS